jgi:hypothetical protein
VEVGELDYSNLTLDYNVVTARSVCPLVVMSSGGHLSSRVR